MRVLYLSDNQLYIGEEANSCLAEVCEDEVDVPEGLVLASSAGTTDSATERRRPLQTPLKPLRERLGEVQVLVLSKNGLRSAALVEGLFSLQHLDLSDNKIDSVSGIVYALLICFPVECDLCSSLSLRSWSAWVNCHI